MEQRVIAFNALPVPSFQWERPCSCHENNRAGKNWLLGDHLKLSLQSILTVLLFYFLWFCKGKTNIFINLLIHEFTFYTLIFWAHITVVVSVFWYLEKLRIWGISCSWLICRPNGIRGNILSSLKISNLFISDIF